MDFPNLLLIKDPDKKLKSLVRKLTHSGETELDKETLVELKSICKTINKDDLIIPILYRECSKYLHKEHSQVRVATVKLIDYLFKKSHLFREKLLNSFDVFLELTLSISQRPKVKLTLPPPKKFAALLKELTAKLIHQWHADYAEGYEKLRYYYKYLKEHNLVDFSQFRVHTHEELIKRQKLAENQEKILTRSIENRLKELKELKPDIEQLLAQIESLLELLVPSSDEIIHHNDHDDDGESISIDQSQQQRQHGIVNLSQNISIQFSPYYEIHRNHENKDIVQNLKELKRQLINVKLIKLISIEKVLCKRSEQVVGVLRDIIELKSKCTNVVLKLGELKIVNEVEEDEGSEREKKEKKKKKKRKRLTTTLDNIDSDDNSNNVADDDGSSSDEFEEVPPKEGLESYIPKSMRFEYGLEAIDPKELQNSRKITLTNDVFNQQADSLVASSSGGGGGGSGNNLSLPCNVRLESGKLCPRRDKIKCPFHGKIIPRDLDGTPINELDRKEEEERRLRLKPTVPEWQDPELLAEIRVATGIDLTMPKKGKNKKSLQSKLANPKTCDLTPKQRLQKRLQKLNNK